MKLTLPLPPNRANARWHWRTENWKKHDYYKLCLATVKTKRPTEEFQHAHITVRFYLWSLMDSGDNLHARLKWPLDWLVQREYIRDDSDAVLQWGPVTQEVDRKNQRVEIELEEITE